LPLIYTDRSRQVDSFRCQMLRYLKYHSVNGYGIDGKARHIPLMTGLDIHECLAGVLEIVLTLGGALLPNLSDDLTRGQIRTVIQAAQKKYRDQVEKLGLTGVEEREVTRVVNEQCCLVEGLTWGWCRVMLPLVVKEYTILKVEAEESFVLGCTCGIGDRKGEPADHEAKDCYGVCQQSRPDFVMRKKKVGSAQDGQVGIHDFKSTAYQPNADTIEEYRTSMQMAVGTLGVERSLGEPVTHYEVHFLVKGGRRKGYTSPNVFEGPRQQQSDFCYVSYSAGNPPLYKESLSCKGKWYEKVPVWELNLARPEGWSAVEYWASIMPQEEIEKLFPRIGPYDRQGWMIPGHLTQVLAEEKRWVSRNWAVYDETSQTGAPLKPALDKQITQSWDCWKYGTTCTMRPICDGTVPWDPKAIMASGLYQLRVPHHKLEEEALRASGVELPAEMLPTGGGGEGE